MTIDGLVLDDGDDLRRLRDIALGMHRPKGDAKRMGIAFQLDLVRDVDLRHVLAARRPIRPTFSPPVADMDLVLVDSNGRNLAFSASYHNTHEALEFWSPSNQVATLKVRRVSCTMDAGNVGWVWFNDALD